MAARLPAVGFFPVDPHPGRLPPDQTLSSIPTDSCGAPLRIAASNDNFDELVSPGRYRSGDAISQSQTSCPVSMRAFANIVKRKETLSSCQTTSPPAPEKTEQRTPDWLTLRPEGLVR